MGAMHGLHLGKQLCKALDVAPDEVRVITLRVSAETPAQAPVVSVNGRDAYTLDVEPTLLGSMLCSKIGIDPSRVKSLRVVARHNDIAHIDAELLGSTEIFDDETFEYLAGLERTPVEV